MPSLKLALRQQAVSSRRPFQMKSFDFAKSEYSSPSELCCVVRARCYFRARWRGNVQDVIKAVSAGITATWSTEYVLGALGNGIKIIRHLDNTLHALEVKLICDVSPHNIYSDLRKYVSSAIDHNGHWNLPASKHYPAPIKMAVFLGDSLQPAFQTAVLSPWPACIDVRDFEEQYGGLGEVFPGGLLHWAERELSTDGLPLVDTVRVLIMGNNGLFQCDPPSVLKLHGFPPIGVQLCMPRVPDLPEAPQAAPSPDASASATSAPASTHASTASAHVVAAATASTYVSSAPGPSPPAPRPPPAPAAAGPTPDVVVTRGGTASTSGGSGAPPAALLAAVDSEDQLMPPATLAGHKRSASTCASAHGPPSDGDAVSTTSEGTALRPS